MNIYQKDGFKIEHMIEHCEVQKKKEKKKKNESFLVLLIEFVYFNK